MIGSLFELPALLLILAVSGSLWFLVRVILRVSAPRRTKIGLSIAAAFSVFGLVIALSLLMAAVNPTFFGVKLATYVLTHYGQPDPAYSGTRVLASFTLSTTSPEKMVLLPRNVAGKYVTVFAPGKVLLGTLDNGELILDSRSVERTSFWWLYTNTLMVSTRVRP